ncbi:MAG TPA: D-alanine--D-alanine ligase [Aquabacterium sp.]|uniref:D-alanine--D-alanine ligase n=1 Tax=Aquabacterium sp. TaxID=1872578 RepID=UPI002E3609BB|nr:D-alanine--D-alanine ligase [Aquabacterium sp.]HEX5372796.1 D-alanine--D-alanine ligase [Aquabacterium sp.]
MSIPQIAPPTIDPKSLGKVAVLFGGSSAEREISMMSGNGVLKALLSQGVDAHAFDPAERPLEDLRKEGFKRCFIALHGRGGEDGTLQQELEWLQIPYTGSGVKASAQAMDKDVTKLLWRYKGIPTPAWRLVDSAQACEEAFDYLECSAMIVKPAREGSSIGLTKVTDRSQCAQAYALAAQHDNEVLCEQFIDGEETTCPVLEVDGEPVALPVIRIAAPQGNYDYQNKYFTDDTKYHCPSGLPADEEELIQRMVVAAYKALGCRGWARADVMIDKTDRQPYALEINTAPGMTSHSLVPMSAKVAGLSYEQLCVYLLSHAALDRVIPGMYPEDDSDTAA